MMNFFKKMETYIILIGLLSITASILKFNFTIKLNTETNTLANQHSVTTFANSLSIISIIGILLLSVLIWLRKKDLKYKIIAQIILYFIFYIALTPLLWIIY